MLYFSDEWTNTYQRDVIYDEYKCLNDCNHDAKIFETFSDINLISTINLFEMFLQIPQQGINCLTTYFDLPIVDKSGLTLRTVGAV